MPRLGNAKHEFFAQATVNGTYARQEDAYVAAGYKEANAKSHASHLIKRPDVAKRIAELQGQALAPVIGDQPDLEDYFSVGWIQQQYELICKLALEQSDYKTANAAIKNVESLIAFENKRLEQSAAQPAPAQRIDVNSLSGILDKVANVVKAAKASPAPGTVEPDSAVPSPARLRAHRATEGEA